MTSESTGGLVLGGDVRPFEFADHHCFACGSRNEAGMQLVLHVEHGRAWTELTYERRFEGWDGIAHGGILCTILDEVMAWSLVGSDNWGLTARLSVDFRRPVTVGTRVRAVGSILRHRRRLIDTEGRIEDATTGAVFATATAIYAAATGDRRAELQARYGFRYLDMAPAGAAL